MYIIVYKKIVAYYVTQIFYHVNFCYEIYFLYQFFYENCVILCDTISSMHYSIKLNKFSALYFFYKMVSHF